MATDKSFGCRFANTEKCADSCFKCELFHRDYISREAAIFEILSEPADVHYPSWYAEKLEDIPAADVRPVLRGEWKKRMEEKNTPYYKSFTPIWSCSECGTEYDPSFCVTINFCPNCGADMAVNDRHYGEEGSDHG